MNHYFIYYDNSKRLYVWEDLITTVKNLEPIYSTNNIPMKYDFQNSNTTMKDNLKILFGE